MIRVIDIGKEPELKGEYSIERVPEIGVFFDEKLVKFYQDEMDKITISKYCDCLSTNITMLSDVFDVIDFQERSKPCNLVVSSFDYLKNMNLTKINGLINVGYCKNKNDCDALNISTGQLTKVVDRQKIGLSKDELMNDELIINESKSIIEYYDDKGLKENTICCFVDEKDEKHMFQIYQIFTYLKHEYMDNFTYKYCGFYKCPNLTKQIGLVNYGNIVFTFNYNNKLFTSSYQNKNKIKEWIENIIHNETNVLKSLYARDFIDAFSNQEKDVIILVGNNLMDKFEESIQNVKILMKFFESYDNIEFYKLDPKTQIIPGLRLPNLEKPYLLISPNSENANGNIIPFEESMSTVLKKIIQSIKTIISPTYVQTILLKLENI